MKLHNIQKTLIVFALVFLSNTQAFSENLVDISCSEISKYPAYLPSQPYQTTIMPDDGWYNTGWHGASSNEGKNEGWGLNIEIQEGALSQDGYLFGAAFVPDENGDPTYVIFNGPIVKGAPGAWRTGDPIATYEGKMLRVTGGLCIGCGENIPGDAVELVDGDIKITWRDNRHAVLKWKNKFIKIAHWQWADNIGQAHTDWIEGRWLVTGDTKTDAISETEAGNAVFQYADKRRLRDVVEIKKLTSLPETLKGRGWIVYSTTISHIRISESPNDKSAGAGREVPLEYYIIYKPASDTWEMIEARAFLKNPDAPFGSFPDYDESPYLRARIFVQGQHRMIGLGIADAAGIHSETTIRSNHLVFQKITGRLTKDGIFLPAAPNVRGCD